MNRNLSDCAAMACLPTAAVATAALPLEIENSNNITLANFHIYRVISTYQPFPWAVKVSNSKNIRFRNVHCYSNSKVSFDAAIFDQTHNLEIRQREFAWLTLSGNAPVSRPASTAKVEKLAGGFYNISGGAVAPNGDFYIADTGNNVIRRVNAAGMISTVVGIGIGGFGGDNGPGRDALLNRPSAVAFDDSGAMWIADTYNQRVRRVAGFLGLQQ